MPRTNGSTHHRNGAGFGPRGTEGKIEAVRYAREEKVPFFGICFGMQMAVIEYARNVCGLERADSTEFDPGTPHRVICPGDRLRAVQGWPVWESCRLGSPAVDGPAQRSFHRASTWSPTSRCFRRGRHPGGRP